MPEVNEETKVEVKEQPVEFEVAHGKACPFFMIGTSFLRECAKQDCQMWSTLTNDCGLKRG